LAKFFETGDKNWPLLVPMTKAVSRALDAVEHISASAWHQRIQGVVLTGASKRGWTTWLAAAQDPRIKAIAPEVFEMVNIPAQLDYQLSSWGRYSEEIGDYSQNGLPTMLATARGKELLAIIDPYQIRQRLTLPKLLILGTNDAYWPVDAATQYFNALHGPKYLLYMPNAGHEISDRSLIDANLRVLSRAASGDLALPDVTFQDAPDLNKSGLVWQMKASQTPVSCSLWRAQAKSRDFRQAVWSKDRALDPKKDLKITVPAAPGLYTATFVRAAFDLGGGQLTVTSLVNILPPK
jgi:PhoPQ-activated pathogenicity-related protein